MFRCLGFSFNTSHLFCTPFWSKEFQLEMWITSSVTSQNNSVLQGLWHPHCEKENKKCCQIKRKALNVVFLEMWVIKGWEWYKRARPRVTAAAAAQSTHSAHLNQHHHHKYNKSSKFWSNFSSRTLNSENAQRQTMNMDVYPLFKQLWGWFYLSKCKFISNST